MVKKYKVWHVLSLRGRARDLLMSMHFKKVLLAFMICALCKTSEAATVTNAASGDWSTKGTWIGNSVPALTDNIVIVTNTMVTLSKTIKQSGVVTINAGGTLSDGGSSFGVNNNLNPGMIINGTFLVTVATGLTKNGPGNNPTVRVNSGGQINFNITSATSGITAWDLQPGSTILYSAPGPQAINNNITSYANLTLSGSGTKTLGINATVNGTLSLQGAPATFALGAGISLTYGANAVLEYKASAAQTAATVEFPTTMRAAVVIDNPSGVSSATPRTLNNNLTLSRGTFTLSSALTLSNGVTVTRATGSFSAAPTFGTTVNLVYTGTTGVTAGSEMPTNTTVLSNLTVNYSSSATLTLNAARTVNGLLTIGSSSTLAVGNFVLTAKGNVANSGAQSGTGKILLAGASSQTLSGAGTYGNVEVSNNSDILLTGSPTVNGALTLTTGHINTQTDQLNLASGATVARTSGWVNGELQKAFAMANGQSFIYPIGDNSTYRPVALANLNVTTPGTLLASCSGPAHSQLGLSDINTSKAVAQFWTLTPSALVASGTDATFTFASGDILGSADPNKFVIRRWNGSKWFVATTGTRTATSTQATGLSAFGDFAVGEPLSTTALVTLPGQTFISGSGNSGTASNQIAGVSFNILLSAVTTLTNLDLSYSGLKTISYSGPTNSPNGSPAVYTKDVSFTNGQATLVATILKNAKTTTIAAEDGSVLTNKVPSSSFTVVPGDVSTSNSTVTASPTSLLADGVALSTNTVTLKDSYGNPVSGKTVTLAKTSGSGSPTVNTLQGTTDASGVALFTVSSTTASINDFTATDTTDSLTVSQTSTVTFQPGELHHFAITPSPITGTFTVGTQITGITLTAQDVNNNTVSGFQGDVTFGGTAGVTGNSDTFVNGVLTGVSVTPLVAGTDLTLTVVNALGKTGSTTISLIEAAGLDHYSVDFTRPVYAGVPFTVVITAQDAYNNVTTNGLEGKAAALTTTIVGPTFTPNPIITWTNGQGATATVFDNEGTNLTITAFDGTYTGTSETFDVIAKTGSYRTRTSGNWDGTGTWEAYMGGSWTATNLPPAAACPSVLIKANHTVTVSTTPSEALGKTHVDGTLIIATNATLTIAGHMDVHNLLQNNGTLNVANTGELFVQTPGPVLIDNENNVVSSGGTPYTLQGLFVNAGSLTNSGALSLSLRPPPTATPAPTLQARFRPPRGARMRPARSPDSRVLMAHRPGWVSVSSTCFGIAPTRRKASTSAPISPTSSTSRSQTLAQPGSSSGLT